MRRKLKDIAVIQVGYTFRVPPSSLGAGDVAVIQARDLTPENRVAVHGLLRVQMEIPKEHHLVKMGDLVFKSRGNKFNSAILMEDPGPTVVAGPLFLIRVSSNGVLPEYLNWFMSQSQAQEFMTSFAEGTLQMMIHKEALEELEISIPPINRQKAILALASLGEEEQMLMTRIAEQRKKIMTAQLNQLAKGE
jgi:hypothetical protein